MIDHHEVFAKRLQEELEDQNMSQAELASQLGRRRSAVNKWIRNGMFPEVQTIIKICDVLYVSADYLLGLDDER